MCEEANEFVYVCVCLRRDCAVDGILSQMYMISTSQPATTNIGIVKRKNEMLKQTYMNVIIGDANDITHIYI